mgnify:CR=1 FL=1
MYSSGLPEGILPIAVPAVIDSIQEQSQHVLGIVAAPLGAGTFESLLYEVAMSALDLDGANRQVLA